MSLGLSTHHVIETSLLATSKQNYSEAIGILSSSNHFILELALNYGQSDRRNIHGPSRYVEQFPEVALPFLKQLTLDLKTYRLRRAMINRAFPIIIPIFSLNTSLDFLLRVNKKAKLRVLVNCLWEVWRDGPRMHGQADDKYDEYKLPSLMHDTEAWVAFERFPVW